MHYKSCKQKDTINYERLGNEQSDCNRSERTIGERLGNHFVLTLGQLLLEFKYIFTTSKPGGKVLLEAIIAVSLTTSHSQTLAARPA